MAPKHLTHALDDEFSIREQGIVHTGLQSTYLTGMLVLVLCFIDPL